MAAFAFKLDIESHLREYLAEDTDASFTETELNNSAVPVEFFINNFGSTKGSIKIRGLAHYNERETIEKFDLHCSAFSVLYRLALIPMLKVIPQEQLN